MIDVSSNVQAQGRCAALLRSVPWSVMLGALLLAIIFVNFSLADLTDSVVTIGLCLVSMKIRKTFLNLAGLTDFPYRTFHSLSPNL